jgi:hypothetical protein
MNLLSGTYKMKKLRFQEEGYDINEIKDKMYFLLKGEFVPLDQELFDKINTGKIRL